MGDTRLQGAVCSVALLTIYCSNGLAYLPHAVSIPFRRGVCHVSGERFVWLLPLQISSTAQCAAFTAFAGGTCPRLCRWPRGPGNAMVVPSSLPPSLPDRWRDSCWRRITCITIPQTSECSSRPRPVTAALVSVVLLTCCGGRGVRVGGLSLPDGAGKAVDVWRYPEYVLPGAPPAPSDDGPDDVNFVVHVSHILPQLARAPVHFEWARIAVTARAGTWLALALTAAVSPRVGLWRTLPCCCVRRVGVCDVCGAVARRVVLVVVNGLVRRCGRAIGQR